MVEAYRGGVSVTEEKPASRDIPWRQHTPVNTVVGTGAGPRLPGGQDSPRLGLRELLGMWVVARRCGQHLGHLRAMQTHGSTQPLSLTPYSGVRVPQSGSQPPSVHKRAFCKQRKGNYCEDIAEYPSLLPRGCNVAPKASEAPQGKLCDPISR